MEKPSERTLNREKEKFENYLERSGLRFSHGRKTVFDETMKAHGHFAAEEIVKQCHKKNRKVSRATIYRSIQELRQSGIIRETAFGEKHQHFEHIYDERLHHHARCIHCHSLIEFACKCTDQKYNNQLKTNGFDVLGHEMHFYGICKNCQK